MARREFGLLIILPEKTYKKMSDSLSDAIRGDPQRFAVDMDLRNIYDEETFKKEVERARLRAESRYSSHVTRWARQSKSLFDTRFIRDVINNNVRSGEMKDDIKIPRKDGKFMTIRGYDLGDGTFLMTKSRKDLTGKTVKFVVRKKNKLHKGE